MKTMILSLIAAGILGSGVGVTYAIADDTSTTKLTPTFPKSDKCTTSTPCRDVVGQIVKIEEIYLVQTSNGNQTHMRISPETKIESRMKVGDSVAAQLTSSGDADAIIKFEQKPKTDELAKPKETLKDMR